MRLKTRRNAAPFAVPADVVPDEMAVPDAVLRRLRVLLQTLGGHAQRDDDGEALIAAVADVVDVKDPSTLWLAHAVIAGELPTVTCMEAVLRVARRDGVGEAVRELVASATTQSFMVEMHDIEVLTDAVTVDVHHTSQATFTSGIQRVVRETVTRWSPIHHPVLVGWTDGYEALVRLPEGAQLGPAAQASVEAEAMHSREQAAVIVVPWGGQHVIPELTAEPERSARVQAFARYGRSKVSFIGYDCIPITSAETVSRGMSSVYARYLVSIRESHRLAPISRAAADEFRGWRHMTRANGFSGPDIREVTLPVQAAPSTEAEIQVARDLFLRPGIPLVLVVGSHEPRKNHVAVLHAAEVLWEEGLRFTVAFVGAGSWGAESFYETAERLQRQGRSVTSIRGLADPVLWAAYRIAHCVMFPSLNEGFGLPIAESLAVGTPVITSGFGSMCEIVAPTGEPRGGLLVDPRDDASIVDALRRMLTDTELYARLRTEAAELDLGSWDQYASDLWSFLVNGEIEAH